MTSSTSGTSVLDESGRKLGSNSETISLVGNEELLSSSRSYIQNVPDALEALDVVETTSESEPLLLVEGQRQERHCTGHDVNDTSCQACPNKIMEEAKVTNDMERDEDNEAACRICLESDDGENPSDTLISPCKCKGSAQFVHRSCLDHWRAVKEGFAFAHCTTCKAQYHLRPDLPEDMSWRQRKFQLFVTRDLCLVFLAVQAIILVIGGLLMVADYKKSVITYMKALNSGFLFYYFWGLFVFLVLFGIAGMIAHCLYCQQLGVQSRCSNCGAACVGNCGSELVFAGGFGELFLVLIVVLAFLGLVYGVLAALVAWQRIWQRHYHILAKKVLAEEYVVQDLHGHYTEPTLNEEDERRLKSLGFL